MKAEDYCYPVKTCQTSDDISAHVDLNGPKLVVNGQAVANINARFCVHTVVDGTKNLKSGSALPSDRFVKKGLQIAVADVRRLEDVRQDLLGRGAATFDEAQVACAALKLYNKTWFAPKVLEYGEPRELDATISLQSLGQYFFSHGREDAYWSSSVSPSSIFYAWFFIGPDGGVYQGERTIPLAVRCVGR